MVNDYKISVITICFNNLEDVIATCKSVDLQSIPPFEHWIIDGSTDDTISNFMNNTPQPGYRKWLCEKDSGIADAFNKGILLAKGDILNMLNSGDYYYSKNTISTVTDTFKQYPEIKWLHGKYQLMRGGKWIIIGKPFDPDKLYRGMRSLAHQSMFVKKNLHEVHGLYDTRITIAMDYDFVCRIAREPFLFLKDCLVVFAPGGTSQVNYLNSLEQTRLVYEKYYGYSFFLYAWQIRLKMLHTLMYSPIGKILYKIKLALKLENL